MFYDSGILTKDKYFVVNCRPISIFSVLCKVMEKVIVKFYFPRYKLINDKIYEFRQQTFTSFVANLLVPQRSFFNIIALDISKDFDIRGLLAQKHIIQCKFKETLRKGLKNATKINISEK